MKPATVLIAMFLARPAQAEESRRIDETDAFAGKDIYLRECSACHGERGDGDGPAAPFLSPRPRNFTAAMFKLRTTPSGEAPRTDDVVRTIERGIPGTSMPSFAFLGAVEREKVAAYVLRFGDLLETPEPPPIPKPGAHVASAETIARGKLVYAEQQCASCHGERGLGDGPSAKTLKDSEGRPIEVRDFTAGVFRGGSEPIDLYYRFTTGMDGSPMPSFGDLLDETDRWALVDYIMSLRVKPAPVQWPKDPIKAGRMLADKFGCRGCHVLDDGKGGNVGPDLRISSKKLGAAWVKTFLHAPREYGKIYPWRTSRMPDLALDEKEIEVAGNYLAAMSKRKSQVLEGVDPAAFPAAKLEEGKNLFVIRCTECHTLGEVIVTPPFKQQGPDLIKVADRIHYDWADKWILDPKKLDPATKMTVPGLTPEQVEAVRMFVWKTSLEAKRGG
jgi:mono/diheme cytochrome c family protein